MHSLHRAYRSRRRIISRRLTELRQDNPLSIFYELCFCLLTPGSRAHACWDAVLRLQQKNFYRKHIRPVDSLFGVRFHNNKSRYLLAMKQTFPSFLRLRLQEDDPFVIREWLVSHVDGLGMKEASHFLRNIGYRGLAILDRHILTNLIRRNVLKEIPATLTKKRYLAIEQRFRRFSERLQIPMDHLDLLFWSEETGEVFK